MDHFHIAAFLLGLPLLLLSHRIRSPCCRGIVLLLGMMLEFGTSGHLTIVARATSGAWAAHWCPGLILNAAGARVIEGDGGPLKVRFWVSLLGVALFMGTIIAESVVLNGLQRFYNWVHMLLYTIGAVLSLGGGLHEPLTCCGCERTASTVAMLRCVLDPLCFAALGAIFIVLEPLRDPLATFYHAILGRLLIVLGLAIHLCSLTHHVMPREHMFATTMRLVHALAYMLPGCWMMQMSIMMYSSFDGGLVKKLRAAGIKADTGIEEAGALFALNLLVSAGLLAFAACGLTAPEPAKQAGQGRAPHFGWREAARLASEEDEGSELLAVGP